MRRRQWIAAAVLAVFTLSGCYTISYNTQAPGSGQYRESRGDFFLWGLVGDETFDLVALCPQGVSRWKSEQTFLDGLIGLVTLGIYVRRHVTVECAGATAYRLQIGGMGEVLARVPVPARPREEARP